MAWLFACNIFLLPDGFGVVAIPGADLEAENEYSFIFII